MYSNTYVLVGRTHTHQFVSEKGAAGVLLAELGSVLLHRATLAQTVFGEGDVGLGPGDPLVFDPVVGSPFALRAVTHRTYRVRKKGAAAGKE